MLTTAVPARVKKDLSALTGSSGIYLGVAYQQEKIGVAAKVAGSLCQLQRRPYAHENDQAYSAGPTWRSG